MSVTLQKSNFWKRISAYLFDLMLSVMIVLAFALALSSMLNYDSHTKKLQNYYTQYEQEYGIDFDISQEDYDKLSPEEQASYQQKRQECTAAMNQDPQVQKVSSLIFQLTFVIISVSILLGLLTIYFIVPLFFHNGQTLGKKMFGLAVVRTNCVKISNPVLFVRSILGLYAMETMFPIFILLMIYFELLGSIGTITLLLFFGLQIGVMISTKGSSIHDLLSDTAVVEFSSQRIFDTQEELTEYQKAEAAKQAAETESAETTATAQTEA